MVHNVSAGEGFKAEFWSSTLKQCKNIPVLLVAMVTKLMVGLIMVRGMVDTPKALRLLASVVTKVMKVTKMMAIGRLEGCTLWSETAHSTNKIKEKKDKELEKRVRARTTKYHIWKNFKFIHRVH